MSEQQYFIQFKYLKNRQIDLGTGAAYTIPMKQKKLKILGHQTTTPVFNLDAIHKVPLLDENVHVPERDEFMSDRMFNELSDEAYREALENRKRNKVVRERLAAYVKSGTLEVIHDPFARKTTLDVAQKPALTVVVPEVNDPEWDKVDTAEPEEIIPNGETGRIEVTESFDQIEDATGDDLLKDEPSQTQSETQPTTRRRNQTK